MDTPKLKIPEIGFFKNILRKYPTSCICFIILKGMKRQGDLFPNQYD